MLVREGGMREGSGVRIRSENGGQEVVERKGAVLAESKRGRTVDGSDISKMFVRRIGARVLSGVSCVLARI